MRKLKQNENVDNDKVSWKKLFHIYYLKIFVKILFLYLVFIRCVGNILIIYYIIFLHYKTKLKNDYIENFLEMIVCILYTYILH